MRRLSSIRHPLMLVVLSLLSFTVLLVNPPTASAESPQATINMPFDGYWAWYAPAAEPWDDGTGDDHPRAHPTRGAHWGTDLYAVPGTDVQINVGPSSMPPQLIVNSVTDAKCAGTGESVRIDVVFNGVTAGWVQYDHVETDLVAGVALNNRDVIGVLKDWPTVPGCYTARPEMAHVHVGMRNAQALNACFVDQGQPGSARLGTDDALGIIGAQNDGGRQACTGTPDGSSAAERLFTTASTEDTPAAGDFNGDKRADTVLALSRDDKGVDIHIVPGGDADTLFDTRRTFVRTLPANVGWELSRMKMAVGYFDGNQFADVAIMVMRENGDVDVNVLFGGTQPLQDLKLVRTMPASQGWNFMELKVVSGDVNGDGRDDLLFGRRGPDDGMIISVLYGALEMGLFADLSHWERSLPASAGWHWRDLKLAAGLFNRDGSADLAVMQRTADDGVRVYVLSAKHGFNTDYAEVQHLSEHRDWRWSETKLAAGFFRGDRFADLVLMQRSAKGGLYIYTVRGGEYPFTEPVAITRSLPAEEGWNWDLVQPVAGQFQGTGYAGLALFSQAVDNGLDIHLLDGANAVGPFTNDPRIVGELPAFDGWIYNRTKVA